MLRTSANVLGRVLNRPLQAGRSAWMSQRVRGVVTAGYEVHSPFPDVEPMDDVVSVIMNTARRFGHHTAVECSVTGRSYTYAQLEDASFRWAGALQRMGVRRGDVVGIFAPNCPEYPVVFLGTMIAGAAVTCFNPTYTPVEVARQVTNSGIRVMVVDPLLEQVLDAALSDLKRPPRVVLTTKSPSSGEKGRAILQEIAEDETQPFGEFVQVSDHDLCVLGYSSGTTGVPKGARFLHGGVAANLAMVLHPQVFPYAPTTAEFQEAVIGLMPFYHAWGMYGVMTCSLALGAKVVTMPQFMPDVFLDVTRKHKVGVLHLVPPLLQFLAVHPMVTPDDLASVRSAMCAAAPCPPQVALAFKKKAPNPVFFQEVYGMTETMPTHFTPLNGAENIGSCGVLLPCARARVEDLESGVPLPPGETGELVIHTPALMSGYHGNEDATRDVMTADGWLRTGDVAKYDKDGYFYIVDRIKELIKVKGLQVSPTELEEELLLHPSVAEVGVVGVADPRAGEVPRAYVVRKEDQGVEDEELLKEKLKEYLAARVAPHKHLLGGIHFVEDLPRNPTGKLLRRSLKEKAEREG